ncbi:MAG: HNH endonuclease [Acetatifactor sp.]|nr:HNH endonuclease [Acetatifactor sp.]
MEAQSITIDSSGRSEESNVSGQNETDEKVEAEIKTSLSVKEPVSKGGITEEDNLQTLCWKCNRKKGSML